MSVGWTWGRDAARISHHEGRRAKSLQQNDYDYLLVCPVSNRSATGVKYGRGVSVLPWLQIKRDGIQTGSSPFLLDGTEDADGSRRRIVGLLRGRKPVAGLAAINSGPMGDINQEMHRLLYSPDARTGVKAIRENFTHPVVLAERLPAHPPPPKPGAITAAARSWVSLRHLLGSDGRKAGLRPPSPTDTPLAKPSGSAERTT
jgi:hypothetical protein